MSKPAFLVEGKMEQLIVQRLCPGAPVRILNCNGDDVALDAIAKRVGTLGRLLQGNYWPLIVILDREGRTLSVVEMKNRLIELLKQEQVETELIVGIPDRMIENWILADFDNFCRCAGVERGLFTPTLEGTSGAARLKSFLQKEASYVKTIHGVDWFIKSDPDTIQRNSESFRSFVAELVQLKCRWLSERRLI